MSRVILVVDDDPLLPGVIAEVLRPSGARVLMAGNVAEAIGMLAGIPEIELVLIDVMLSGAPDGIAVARAARSRRSDIRLVYMGVDPVVRPVLESAPTGSFLAKPFRAEQLLAAVSATPPRHLAKERG